MITGKIVRGKKIEQIDIEKILLGKFKLRQRYDNSNIELLAQSIKTFGVLQPVTVRKFNKNFELISGERRVAAAKMAGLTKIPAIVVEARFDTALAMALAENNQREEMRLMDSAESYMDYIRRRGITCMEMGEMIGVSPEKIFEDIKVLQQPKKIQNVFSKYNLTREHLEAVSVLDSEKDRVDLLKRAAIEKCSPDKLEQLAKRVLEEKKVRKQVVKDVKIFWNTINQAVAMIKKTGKFVSSEKNENEHFIEYVIKVEK